MRWKPQLIFEGQKDAPTFGRDLRRALEPLRSRADAFSLKVESAGTVLRVWLTRTTVARVMSRNRWTTTSKAEQAGPISTRNIQIDLFIEALCSDSSNTEE